MGCGPGNSTALLVARYPEAEVLGIDSSKAMLEAARKAVPNARFEEADATVWSPEPDTDLVFANAIFQWVPDHLAVFSRILASLKTGAVLAVQMPDNLTEPAHRMMEEVAADSRWAKRLEAVARTPLAPVRDYYDALRPAASRVDLWHTIYNHVLDGPAAIVEWMRGTGLRTFIEPLTAEERREFVSHYAARVAEAYTPAVDGRVLLRFPRLFIVATRQ